MAESRFDPVPSAPPRELQLPDVYPNTQQVNAAGLLTAFFPLGVSILAGLGAATPPDERRIRWVRESDGSLVADTWANDVAPDSNSMSISVEPRALDDARGQLHLRSSSPTRNGQANLEVNGNGTAHVNVNAAGTPGKGSINLEATEEGVIALVPPRAQLWNSDRFSAFPQLGFAANGGNPVAQRVSIGAANISQTSGSTDTINFQTGGISHSDNIGAGLSRIEFLFDTTSAATVTAVGVVNDNAGWLLSAYGVLAAPARLNVEIRSPASVLTDRTFTIIWLIPIV